MLQKNLHKKLHKILHKILHKNLHKNLHKKLHYRVKICIVHTNCGVFSVIFFQKKYIFRLDEYSFLIV